tara:strand:- start:4849 stop:5511 length:663 start_codon:yes stop_codon:yes gene_type:complete
MSSSALVPIALALSSLLVLSGCEQPLQNAPTVNYTQVETVTAIHAVRFGEGQSRLDKSEQQRLYRYLAPLVRAPEDRVLVEWPRETTPGDGSLAAARSQSVQQDLRRIGLQVAAYSPKESRSGRVRVLVERLALYSPGDCLAPKRQPGFSDSFVNGADQKQGCATADNFAKMLANPYDAKRGGVTGPARTERLTTGQQRYDSGAPLSISTDSAAGLGGGG